MQNYDDVFRQSFQRVLGDGAYNPAFIGRFYAIFLDASTEIAERFARTDMSAQRTMLHDSLHTMVDFHQTRVPTARLQQLAASHSRAHHNIPPNMYELWLNSLVATVAELDTAFSPDVELAWRIALGPGISFMQFAYAQH